MINGEWIKSQDANEIYDTFSIKYIECKFCPAFLYCSLLDDRDTFDCKSAFVNWWNKTYSGVSIKKGNYGKNTN